MDSTDLACSLRKRLSSPQHAQDLAQRVRLVLETQPGRVPWRPEFGCDLEGLSGAAASETRLEEARKRISTALARFLPEAHLVACEVSLGAVQRTGLRDRRTPIAEAALASAGISATLEVAIVLQTDGGTISLEATLSR